MKYRVFRTVFIVFITATTATAQKGKTYQLSSPNGSLQLMVTVGKQLQWAVTHEKQPVISLSSISLKLQTGEVLGNEAKIASAKIEKINTTITALNYKKDSVLDNYSQLTLNCKGDYGLIFRVYDEGMAYRFFTGRKNEITIRSEEATFNFSNDYMAYIPYVNDPHNNDKYECSFENNYQHIKLSEFKKDTLAFAPVLVELENGKKAVITEADLEDYPGMFLEVNQPNTLSGDFAPYVLAEKQGGHNDLQAYVTKRADYIARTKGSRRFPWRVVIISENDKDLLDNDMVYKLASPLRLTDVSWIKPGKVAWDWWSDWNISHVDFRAGINTATYRYFIDFAAANHIENILLDEGWADSRDIMKIVPGVNLQEIIDYGKQKNVDVWLWGGWLPLDQKIDEALSTYAKMGIKGFKIDFMDRDDQKMLQFYYRMSAKAAQYHLMVDYHGTFKPTGLQRTYPNVMGFEGVRGMENVKWSNTDFPEYELIIPFVRMIAGPMDYTPGAMRNAGKANYRPVNSMPMSQGTRCHQLAMYIMYEAPFEMLCDNPTAYTREPESLEFLASVPTTFNETVALDGKVAAYAIIARRKGETWYVGAMGNWDEHDITIDLSFLKQGNYEAEVFKDGINADRDATDYKKEIIKVSAGQKLNVHLSAGGGWVAKIHK